MRHACQSVQQRVDVVVVVDVDCCASCVVDVFARVCVACVNCVCCVACAVCAACAACVGCVITLDVSRAANVSVDVRERLVEQQLAVLRAMDAMRTAYTHTCTARLTIASEVAHRWKREHWQIFVLG